MDSMETTPETQVPSGAPSYSLRQLLLYALRLGATGFGGPVALVGYMHRDLVQDRKWISEADYKVGLALAQLSPGPLAAQLAIYLGFVHYRTLGATLVGIAFALPSFLMVLGISWAYVLYGGLPWMQAIFYGVGAAVIGIIAYSAYRLTQRTVGKDWLLWAIFGVMMAVTAITESEKVEIILVAGLLVWLVQTRPNIPRGLLKAGSSIPELLRKRHAVQWRTRTVLLALAAVFLAVALPRFGPGLGVLWDIALFFGKAGAFVFGSGLAIVPFLYGGVVNEFQWLNDQQFVDAVAVAMVTPGPVVITTGFIGFLVAGFAGAVVAATATFLPPYLLTIFPAPYFKKYGSRPGIVAFVQGVTAGAIGAIAGAVIVLAQRSIVDIPTTILAVLTVGLLAQRRVKIPEPLIVLAAAVFGLIAYPLVQQ